MTSPGHPFRRISRKFSSLAISLCSRGKPSERHALPHSPGVGSGIGTVIGSKIDKFTIIFTSLPTHSPPGAFITITSDRALCPTRSPTVLMSVSSVWAWCPIVHRSTFRRQSVYPRLSDHCPIRLGLALPTSPARSVHRHVGSIHLGCTTRGRPPTSSIALCGDLPSICRRGMLTAVGPSSV